MDKNEKLDAVLDEVLPVEPCQCKFNGYLDKDGKNVIEVESSECQESVMKGFRDADTIVRVKAVAKESAKVKE